MRSRWLRRTIAALLASALVLGLAGALAWRERRELLHAWGLRELARRGIAPTRFEVVQLDTRHLALRDLRAGANDALAIDALDLAFTPRELWNRRIRALRITGVRLRGEIDEAGARFGGLEAFARADDGATAEPGATPAALRLPPLPSSELTLEDARAELATAQGPLRVELSLVANESDGRVRARGDLVAHHALADARGVLDLAGAGDAIDGGAAFGIELAPGTGLELPFSAGTLAQSARLEIRGPEIRVSLAPGPFSLTFGDGKDALELAGTLPEASVRTRIAPDGTLAPLALAAAGGELRARQLDLTAGGLELDVTLGPGARQLTGRLALAEVLDTRKPRRAPDLALEASVKPRGDALAFDLRARDSRGRAALRAHGSLDPRSGQGDAELRLAPLAFAKGGLQPEQLAPQLAGVFTSVVGSLEANGRLRFGGGRRELTLDVAARELGFETKLARVEGLNGTLRLEGPDPWRTPAGQSVSLARVAFGLDLTNGLIRGALRPDGSVEIESAEWNTLGGRVRTAGRLEPEAPVQALVLEAEGLDLAQLLALVALDGLSGEGALDGSLPIERSAEKIEIDHGAFRARPGGRLRYRPADGGSALRRQGQGFELLLGALEDLSLEKLELSLDGDANGPLRIGLQLVGVNPAFQGGRPIHYNLNVEARLADLLRQSAAVSKIPQEIEEKLERFRSAHP